MWPIMLTRDQSAAVRLAMEDFSKSLEGEARAVFAIVLSQVGRGVTLGHEEQELIRAALLRDCRDGAGQHAETAYFRLYGVWPIRPTWWETAGPVRMGRPLDNP